MFLRFDSFYHFHFYFSGDIGFASLLEISHTFQNRYRWSMQTYVRGTFPDVLRLVNQIWLMFRDLWPDVQSGWLMESYVYNAMWPICNEFHILLGWNVHMNESPTVLSQYMEFSFNSIMVLKIQLSIDFIYFRYIWSSISLLVG